MPYQFTYENPTNFLQGDLICQQCIAQNRQNTKCKKITCFGTPYCWVHLYYKFHLKIKPSTIPGAGNGLFAMDTSKPQDAIIFKKGDEIAPFFGEKLTLEDVKARYGKYLAPYVIMQNKKENVYVDGAFERTAASMINHKAHSRANCRFSVSYKGILLKATKNIRNNDEIFASYGRDYKMNDKNVQFETKKISSTAKRRAEGFKRYAPKITNK